MTTNLDTARARLRAADPAGIPADPHDPTARAMFERIVTGSAEPVPVRTRSPRRRLVLAGAGLAAVAAVAIAGVVTTPWSHGHPGSAAFAVTERPDGSIHLVIRWTQLRDPAALNRELDRLHARTVVIQQSATCQVEFPFDPAHPPYFRVDPSARPDLEAIAAWMRSQRPWLTFVGFPATADLVIHPSKFPADDTLLIPYEFAPAQPASSDPPVQAGIILVPGVPACVPTPENTVYTKTTVRSR